MSLTREEENFVKLSKIILDIVANHIRMFFKEKWDLKYPHKIWDDTTSVSGQFLLTQIRCKPNTTVKSHLQVGDTRYWDPTALFFVLLQSGLPIIDQCRYPSAKRTIPLRDSEELDKLREIRNEYFAHASSMSVSQGDYQKVIAVIELVCKALNWHCALNEIKTVDQSPIETQLSDDLGKELAAQKTQNDEYIKYLIKLEERMGRMEESFEETRKTQTEMGKRLAANEQEGRETRKIQEDDGETLRANQQEVREIRKIQEDDGETLRANQQEVREIGTRQTELEKTWEESKIDVQEPQQSHVTNINVYGGNVLIGDRGTIQEAEPSTDLMQKLTGLKIYT